MGYALEQERLRHDDALHWFGEMTAFILWWRLSDHLSGLVQRCTRCYDAASWKRVSEAYSQPIQSKCPVCFGTTFEGGIKAIYYRPAIWDLTPVQEDVVRRGEVKVIRGSIEMLSSLPTREGDVAIRYDGTRWQLDQPSWQEMTTGFGSQRGIGDKLSSRAQVQLEDVTAVAYLPYINPAALGVEGLFPYVPHTPHPYDQEAPLSLIDPGFLGGSSLRIERTHIFEFTVTFWLDTARTQPEDVSGRTFRSQIRTAPGGDLIANMSVDMTDAATGSVLFSLSGAETATIVPDVVWIDVLEDIGSDTVLVVDPRHVEVIDVVTE